ncbi:MAG: hypothetical protein ABIU20_01210 [Blastocatellia bacterium]
MLETIDIQIERELGKESQKKFTSADYERGLQALQQLQYLREGLPTVDAVAIIREMRDAGGRSLGEGEGDE